MTQQLVAAMYRKYFEEMNLERCAVLRTFQQWAGCATVLYPGSFIHVTPSFYFQHVVYVDRHPEAPAFFADMARVADFVTRRKHYKQRPFMRFLAQDYTQPLPLRENSFDLLLALYAGGIAQACKAYLRVGGLLLSNNHHDDAGDAARSRDLELVAVMQCKGAACRIVETDLDGYFGSDQSPATTSADYYVFEKVRAPSGTG